MTAHPAVSLDDKFEIRSGRALIAGRQALVRLPLLQRVMDQRAGLKTAGYISGYRGSPLGSFDAELWKASKLLDASGIVFNPGVNEDLALTAVAGTQQLDFVPGRKVDGVFGLWYGKGPGVDRSGDAIKHANLMGTSPLGGVVLVFGDDHAGKSSTTAHQSDLTLASWGVPILYPATVSEVTTMGLAAIAMSRYSGALVGLKIVNETAESTAVIDLSLPPGFALPDPIVPEPSVHIRPEYLAMQQQEARLQFKLIRAHAFARANGLDHIAFGSRNPKLLMATSGKAFADVLDALRLLGLDEAACDEAGLGVYKIALLYPFDEESMLAAAPEAAEIFFVEEKQPHVETQARAALFNRARHLRISGKTTPDGAPLISSTRTLNGKAVAVAIAARVSAVLPGLAPRIVVASEAAPSPLLASPPPAIRRPEFCPGCPHNSSTKVPAGSIGATGIGCHGMAVFHPERNPLPMGQMGAEGANWIGLSHFTETSHIFQNLGDGTYNHSGSLAIRAAVQARVNITFKILFNDAVAMTGGQPVEGQLTVSSIVRQVAAEGVARVVVLAEDPGRFKEERLPPGTDLRHRDDLPVVQGMLRSQPGVSVLIYDQVCAAEKRRRRKVGQFPNPDRRVFINALVCEGCGDCSVQSNCLAIEPMETDLGLKRRIDQSACNKDFSCLKGFCPSFVTVTGAKVRSTPKRTSDGEADLPQPRLPAVQRSFDIMIAGVGGTGVVTIGAILGMAARIEGLGVNLFDMTGLSQKGGAVFSHVRFEREPDATMAAKIGPARAATVIACDLVAAAQPECLETISETTIVVANANVSATAAFQTNRDAIPSASQLTTRLTAAAGKSPKLVSATKLAEQLFGDSIAANMMMLGCAWQLGGVPLSLTAIEQAITLNGKSVSTNMRAFAAGRSAALTEGAAEADALDVRTFVEARANDLTAYWSKGYARRYLDLIDATRSAAAGLSDGEALIWAVARGAYKLMAYKDEYEVARLYTDGRFRKALAREFEAVGDIKIHLSPPLLARHDPTTGRPRKRAFGRWMFPAFRLLSMLRGLRETPLDIFGHSAERQLERSLRDEYLRAINERLVTLSETNLAGLVELAKAPLDVRGFGPVKHEAAEALLGRLTAEPSRSEANAAFELA